MNKESNLVITGEHGVLIDKPSNKQIELMNKFCGGIKIIDGKYNIVSAFCPDFIPVHPNNPLKIYHIVLENENPNLHSSVCANGIWCESMSLKYFDEKSKMTRCD